MFRVRGAVAALTVLCVTASPAWSAASFTIGGDLARVVETRASKTDFAALEAFGQEAQQRRDREGLNRIYHVAWTYLNQGDFDQAGVWNRRLAEAARRQLDDRYLQIARLNQLTIRYDQGDIGVAEEMSRTAQVSPDWFVKAHAARLTALALMDQGRIGEGLKLLTQAESDIPADDPFANTAHRGVWEVAGMGLKALNDVEGAAAAFRRFEIEYADPAYPRPDFDSLYNLTMMALQIGDLKRADEFYQAHSRLARRANLESLSVYDAALCATVAGARDASRDVLACLAPYGENLGAAAFLALDALPLRASARARLGDVEGARRDLARLAELDAAAGPGSELARVQAEILLAEGRPEQAFEILRTYHRETQASVAKSFSAGIRQVTGDMQTQLMERRQQLETAQANALLKETVIQWQNWIVSIGVIFLLCAAGVLAWQWRQAGQLKSARARAEAANRAKSEFLANMSHEIRTPLNGVVAMADALGQRTLDPGDREMVDIIRSSGATLERLLSDILDSARIESGQVTLEPAAFHLGQAARDVAALWRVTAEEKGVALRLDLDEGLDRPVMGDAVRVRQVLTNLVSNALKFTTEGSVTLRVEAMREGRVRFEVEDTGVGFDDEQKSRIFQRFQQADGSITRRFGGTGLGLAISADLVALMGGTLDCASAPGEGARFWFEVDLPAALAEAGESANDPEQRAVPSGTLRILLADDHPANRKVVEVMLSTADIELTAVNDGADALQAFCKGDYDLVLMDMQMPVMDGLTATAEIRAYERRVGALRTPVVMLTANAMSEHVEAGRLAGADGHLTKPLTMASLLNGIETALRVGRATEAA